MNTKKISKEKIIFIYSHESTFVKNDMKILESKYQVIKIKYSHKKSFFHHFSQQIKLIWMIMPHIFGMKSFYIWFADYHSFLPVLISKFTKIKSYIVLGGYDIATVKEVNYGILNNSLRKFMVKFSVNNATLNLAVSNFIKNEALSKYPNSKVIRIYNCVSLKSEQTDVLYNKNIILTVGIVNSDKRFKIKGLDFFIKIASNIQDYDFVIIGIEKKYKEKLKNLPPNLTIYGPLDHEELIEFYRKANIYCQFSKVESFGIALTEAMLFGAVPMVSGNGALKEVVCDYGYIIDGSNINKVKECLSKAFSSNVDIRLKIRKKVMADFSFDNRKREILKIV